MSPAQKRYAFVCTAAVAAATTANIAFNEQTTYSFLIRAEIGGKERWREKEGERTNATNQRKYN